MFRERKVAANPPQQRAAAECWHRRTDKRGTDARQCIDPTAHAACSANKHKLNCVHAKNLSNFIKVDLRRLVIVTHAI